MSRSRYRVGLISDTHGLLRAEALEALRGSDHIVHAGDIGDASILERLASIAPLTAVRGNNDRDAWAANLPDVERLAIGSLRLLVLHELALLALDPLAEGVGFVVSGHSHRPTCERRNGVLYVNPGSAGPRRFRLPVCIAVLSVADARVDVRHVYLDVGPPTASGRRVARPGQDERRVQQSPVRRSPRTAG